MLGAPEGGDFRRWLANAFQNTKPTDLTLLKVIEAIPARRLTLNYDTFLEQTFQSQSLDWTSSAQLLDWLKAPTKDVVHVHGVWGKIAERCLWNVRLFSSQK